MLLLEIDFACFKIIYYIRAVVHIYMYTCISIYTDVYTWNMEK